MAVRDALIVPRERHHHDARVRGRLVVRGDCLIRRVDSVLHVGGVFRVHVQARAQRPVSRALIVRGFSADVLVWGDCGADRGVYGESVRRRDRDGVARVLGDGV